MLFWLYFGQYWSYDESKGSFDWVIMCVKSIGSGLGMIGISEKCGMVKMM